MCLLPQLERLAIPEATRQEQVPLTLPPLDTRMVPNSDRPCKNAEQYTQRPAGVSKCGLLFAIRREHIYLFIFFFRREL